MRRCDEMPSAFNEHRADPAVYRPGMELTGVLEGTDALMQLEAAHVAAWAATDRRLLELCRDRMAMLLGHEPTTDTFDAARVEELSSWPSAGLPAAEVAALALTEQYMIDVSSVTNEQVGALREHLGDAGVANFVNALLVVEQRMRLELIWDGLL